MTLLTQIMEVVVIPLLGILTAYVVKIVNAKLEEVSASRKNELEKKYSCAFGIRDKKNFNVLDKLIEITNDANSRRDIWNIFYRNDEDFWEYVEGDGKSKVSFTDDWKSCLCNLMYLYRTVDWNNEMIMIIGS